MSVDGPKTEAHVFGNLDEPNAEEVAIGEVNVFRGWVLISDGAAIERIEVLCEDAVIGSCKHGVQRDDVLAAHPNRPEAKHSGFEGSVYVPETSRAALQFVVVDGRDRRHQFVTVRAHAPSSDFRHKLYTGAASPVTTMYPDFNTKIHPKCEMYRYARANLGSDYAAAEYYFSSAEFLVKNMQRFFSESGVDLRDKSVLDFASGYGRFARYFVKMFKKVTVSDLEQDMLDFNNQEFGTDAFLSAKSAATLKTSPGRYDVVFCFSLFTHLGDQLWADWFKSLFELVADKGYMIISTHGFELFKKIAPSRAKGWEEKKSDFFFVGVNETGGRLDANSYGTAVVTDQFVRKVASAIRDIRIVKKYEMGDFDQYHDIYIFQKTS